MPAEVNGNHAIARFGRAWVFVKNMHTYYACGDVILTPFFAFISGHYGEHGDYSVIISIAVPREDIHRITDQSVETCDIHDEMDAEAQALMEKSNAKEGSQD